MSHHLLLDRPDRHVVLGFDHPLQSFFGQVFRGPSGDRAGRAIGGWPTSSGLGDRRPAGTTREIAQDLYKLSEWAKGQIIDDFHVDPQAFHHLEALLGLLRRGRRTGEDAPCVPLPDCLKGALRER